MRPVGIIYLLAGLIWLGSLSLSARANVDRMALRALAKTPAMEFSMGFKFSSLRGYSAYTDVPSEWHVEVAALRKAMRGDDSDAARNFQLGLLYSDHQKSELSLIAYHVALKQWQEQARKHPTDGVVLAGLAETPFQVGDIAAADATLQKAQQTAPGSWEVWDARSRLDANRAQYLLIPRNALNDDITNPDAVAGYLAQHRPTTEQIAQCEKLLAESNSAADKAVAVAPAQSEPYAQRAIGRVDKIVTQSVLQALHDPQDKMLDTLRSAFQQAWLRFFMSDAVKDFIAAAQYSHNAPLALAEGIMLPLLAFGYENRNLSDVEITGILPRLPAAQKAIVEGLLAKLEALSHSADKATAQTASLSLGITEIIAKGASKALPGLRRAAKDYPDDEQIAEAYTGALQGAKQNAEMETVARRRIARGDTLRLQLILMKSCEKQDKLKEAEAAARAAIKLAPEDFRANLSLASLELRQADTDVDLHAVQEQMNLTAKLYKPSQDSSQAYYDFLRMRALYGALTGELEAARQQLHEILDANKDDEDAQAALKLLSAS